LFRQFYMKVQEQRIITKTQKNQLNSNYSSGTSSSQHFPIHNNNMTTKIDSVLNYIDITSIRHQKRNNINCVTTSFTTLNNKYIMVNTFLYQSVVASIDLSAHSMVEKWLLSLRSHSWNEEAKCCWSNLCFTVKCNRKINKYTLNTITFVFPIFG